MQCGGWLTLFMLAALIPFITSSRPSVPCRKETFSIKGGSYTVSEDGSIVRYSCPENYYPTVSIRHCVRGIWSPLPNGKKPKCKKITCPDPSGFENGDLEPNSFKYFVNDRIHFSCYSGYEFRGSETRVCQPNGKWSGSTPICGRNSDRCPDPGVPAGTSRTGDEFNIDQKVKYHCIDRLTLIGSKERICLENGQWSGTEPECYADFTYDSPEEAADGFSSSLKANLEVAQQFEEADQYGKKIQVHTGGKMDIYIALDVSGSIDKEDFERAKEVIRTLIEKISYYEVSPNYEILIFATKVVKIVSMSDFKSGQGNNLQNILTKLEEYEHNILKRLFAKGELSGTNIALAYKTILESMVVQERNDKEDFQKTQQIIIMFTDGETNMGGRPKPTVDKIKYLVHEDKLEMYVFGLGEHVHLVDINDLKTDRGNEKFFFKLRNLNDLKETFDKMIDEGTSVALCGLYKEYDDGIQSHKRRRYPWLAMISVIHSKSKISNCMGSLVSPRFILTAAHCFRRGDEPGQIMVKLDSENQGVKVKRYISHPRYNITAKKAFGIPEYYEFDVALIQLEEPVTLSTSLRPICLPCTKETNGALRLSDRDGTCKKHKEILMSGKTVGAAFMSKIEKYQIGEKTITIKQGNLRPACVEDAKRAKTITARNAADIVSDNFLCSGGTEPTVDDVSCKGDSGGATFMVPGSRVIQIGIVSWGVEDLCKGSSKPKSLPHSRDFHTNLFSPDIRSFLQLYLGNESLGTPLTFM
ncbi:hypothetical protein DNTS_034843 [Danionella cerebrum]|uniref:C3/C5 convertase n=1 Tax=Danionella cerebrum TaxID=2873325 RepID=A0A553MLV5_9TELE|nr:hypothetical protein DNTS_034843 [Danionella translucida]